MRIDELAKKAVEEIVELIESGKIRLKDIEEILKNYSDEVKKIIEKELMNELGGFYFTNANPEIAVTPVILSEMLYKNAKNTAIDVFRVIKEGMKANNTIKDIAMKLYEGYDFKDKEILEPMKVLPKYLKEAIKKKDTSIMKQVEKLKTKPLRIAYKDIIRRLSELNEEELKKYIKTAYHEKIRYYANRIAKTETHRAMMSKRAMEYLEDEEVEFVRFEMSAAHPKMDICDFYANLDVGYGKGIIPKKEMRTLPLHPHCRCVYAPYYKKVKGKRKSWKEAVNDTMAKFNENEQKEILGTYDMLNRFKAGEDIEKIFNTIRPKYPIKRYVDLFGKISQKFKENFLDLNKVGYFDENFKEVEIDKICKKVGISLKDIKEIEEKTRFKKEGAVIYLKDKKRIFLEGLKDRVEVKLSILPKIDKLIHSHPRGTSFSVIDIELAIENRIRHLVAFNDEYFYSLKFEKFDFDFENQFVRIFNKYDKILTDKVQKGEISNSQKDFVIAHKIWKELFKRKGVTYEYYRIRKKT